MSQCQYCKHYKFEREVCLYSNSPVTAMGQCKHDERSYGNLTFATSKECENFEPYTLKYHIGDALIHPMQEHVVFITNIRAMYYPNCYRVRTNLNGEYSENEEMLNQYKALIVKED